jgi:hypothetical protein
MHPRERVYGMLELLRSQNKQLPQALITEAKKLGIHLDPTDNPTTKPKESTNGSK